MTDRPLRFCMINTFYPPYSFGGDGIFVHRLSNELARRGHKVDVIHCIDSYRLGARHDPVTVYNDHPNVTVHGIRSPFGFLSPLATQQTGYPLFKSGRILEILKKDFDVIHYHNISLFGPKILQYGHGIKLYSLLEYWLVCPTHTLFRFNRAPCTQPHCFTCSLAYKRPPQWWRYSSLLENSLKHIDTFIAPSRFTENIHRRFGLKTPILRLPYFVLSTPTPKPFGKTSEKPYFLFVGRLEKLKGLHTVIPIFHHYQKAELLIAGTGDDEPRLKKLAGGCDRIRFLGHVSATRLQDLYRRAVAVIVPSICFDVFPLVPIEALSAGTPVVVRNLGGMPEVIEESGAGFVYNTDDELVAAMDRLLADFSYRNQLGQRGYEAYKKNWTAEIHFERYFKLIREIAAIRSYPLSDTRQWRSLNQLQKNPFHSFPVIEK
jgi:glycosyltransferase involved in cell wall biosynthesis